MGEAISNAWDYCIGQLSIWQRHNLYFPAVVHCRYCNVWEITRDGGCLRESGWHCSCRFHPQQIHVCFSLGKFTCESWHNPPCNLHYHKSLSFLIKPVSVGWVRSIVMMPLLPVDVISLHVLSMELHLKRKGKPNYCLASKKVICLKMWWRRPRQPTHPKTQI